MEITIPIFADISLKLIDFSSVQDIYPTSQLQKGILLLKGGEVLAEEGVGFGVPILKRGFQTIFPGGIDFSSRRDGPVTQITAKFTLNLEEKIGRPGSDSVNHSWVYSIKNFLAALIRHVPGLRGLLTGASNAIRRLFNWKTMFVQGEFLTHIDVVYTIDSRAGDIDIEVHTPELLRDGITELIVMNEQGARCFDHYRDANGTQLRGSEIGCWDEVTAESASFMSESHGIGFTLRQLKGAKLYRGRELVGTRLAWSGFGYSFPPTIDQLNYQVRIERL